MNKVVLLMLTSSLALLANGCTFFSRFADSRKELEDTVKPVPVQVSTSQEDQVQEEFADLEAEESEPVQEIAGLIRATNPEVRVRSSVRGRNDPFSVVTLNPRIEVETEEEPVSSKPQRNISAINTQSLENEDNNFGDELELEPIIEPILAQEVFISGLLEANGRTRLIVQAPEESSSRYVEVGQYLSNGQVLVKRIERDNFSNPVVILEESGIEVPIKVGETFVKEDAEDTEISFLPTAKPGK